MRYIYVISGGEIYVKIGTSNHVGKRMRALTTGSPFELSIFDSIKLRSKAQANKHEREIHAKLAPLRARGEWFTIEPKHAMATVLDVVMGDGAGQDYLAALARRDIPT